MKKVNINFQTKNVFFLLGILKSSIENGNDERSLEILAKVTEKVSRMDIDLPTKKREVF